MLLVIDLTLNHRKHTITDTKYWEMSSGVFIVELCPLEYPLNSLCVSIFLMRGDQTRGITWNINSVDLIEYDFKLGIIESEINRDDTGAS